VGAALSRRVVIAGRDAALWLSANVIHAALSRLSVVVDVVELPTLLRSQDVYATLPALEALHNLLGIDEGRLLKLTRGAFTLGQRFGGEGESPSNFFHPYGSVGVPIDDRPFIQYWIKARRFGLSVSFEDFSLTAAAAKCGRMIAPDRETRAFARTDYGYHLPALAYTDYLKKLAVGRGVKTRQTLQLQVDLNGETGFIETLGLDGGREVGGDIFIDATGAEALLIGAGLGVEQESWRAKFPCDRSLSVGGDRFESVPVFAQIRATESGWIGFHPTQAGTGLLKAYNAALLSDDEALRTVAGAARLGQGAAVVSPSDPGRRQVAWRKNCIAIGGAACAFDPVHSVELQAVQLAVVNLLSLFPVATDYSAEQTEYNRLMEASYQRICDFQEAYYALNRYGASAFWTSAREAPMSVALRRKLETFLARGDIPLYDNETFPLESWQSLFLGHGWTPESYSPQIDLTSPDVIKQSFRSILARVKQLVEKQASHDAYLKMCCS
jgi:tryptophan 7-halogenase